MDKLYNHSLLILAAAHSLSSPHDLINQQELLSESRGDVEPLLLGAVVVVNLLLDGGNSAQGLHVKTYCDLVLVVLVLQVDDGLLDIVSTVFG